MSEYHINNQCLRFSEIFYSFIPFSTYIVQHSVYINLCEYNRGSGSSVGIATDYVLGGPVTNPGGDAIFRPSRPDLGPQPDSCKMATGSFPGIKCGCGVLLTSLLVPQSWKCRAISLLTLWAKPGL